MIVLLIHILTFYYLQKMIIPFMFGRESLTRILNSEVQSCALRGTIKGLKALVLEIWNT